MNSLPPFLEVRALSKRFGGVCAVDDVSFKVQAGAIVGLIGPNGAGKTTTFNLISGRFAASIGEVLLNGSSLTGMRPDQIAAFGIARTFQGTRIFPQLTVLENVQIAAVASARVGFWSDLFGLRAARDTEAEAKRFAVETLDWIGLSEFSGETAGSMAYAHQSMLGIALAVSLRPKLVLLDEPFAGMNPGETQRAAELVRKIRDRGMTVVLVEHDVPSVMRICDRIVVLNQGAKIAEGTPQEIQNNQSVIEAYLGVENDAQS